MRSPVNERRPFYTMPLPLALRQRQMGTEVEQRGGASHDAVNLIVALLLVIVALLVTR